jgi:hypothetical protein
MDIAFGLYGLSLFTVSWLTFVNGLAMWRRITNNKRHRIMTNFLFYLALGSLFFRIMCFPLYFLEISEKNQLLWMNICSWLMFMPQLIAFPTYYCWKKSTTEFEYEDIPYFD